MSKEYNADSVKVFKFPDSVRKRTSMYLGEEEDWATRCLVEIVDNGLDEARAKHANKVKVLLDKTKIVVFDNGRGIPVEKHKDTGNPTLQTVFDTIHAGGKFDQKTYEVSAGTNGSGGAAVNAMSKSFKAWTYRNGKWNHIHFEKGILKKKLCVSKPPYKWQSKGTIIEFEIDSTIIKSKINLKYVSQILKFSSYLIPKLEIIYENKNTGKNFVFKTDKGLAGYLSKMVKQTESESLTSVFKLESKFCSCFFQFVKSDESSIETYVNGARTLADGTHLNGFKEVLHEIIQDRANKKDSNFKPEDILDGLVCVLNVNIPDAKFQSQVKDKLTTKDASDWVYDCLEKDLKKWCSSNNSAIKEIIERANLSRKAKVDWEQTRKAALAVKGKRGKSSLPGAKKFAACTSKNPNERELYILEGDSALGTARMARDPKYQEVLCLRGKILNVEKDKVQKVFESEEVVNILKAIGYSPEDKKFTFRVGKVIMLADADSDGSHIECLVATLLQKLCPELIKKNMLFTVDAPLYVGKTDTKSYYGSSLTDLKKQCKSFKAVTRIKGWGECSPNLLRDVAFSKKATLISITESKGKELKEALLVMGDDSTARKKLLSEKVG